MAATGFQGSVGVSGYSPQGYGQGAPATVTFFWSGVPQNGNPEFTTASSVDMTDLYLRVTNYATGLSQTIHLPLTSSGSYTYPPAGAAAPLQGSELAWAFYAVYTDTHELGYGTYSIPITYPPPSYSAPASPSLAGPAAGSTINVADGVTLTGVYNSTDGTSQSAYACRIKTSGGSYQYWNATSGALQSTIVWNAASTAPGGTFDVALPAGVIANGATYNWSLASQNGSGAKQGPFATDATFTAETGPAVTNLLVAVTGSIANVSWTTVCDSGASQTYWRCAIYTEAQYTAAGFTPGTSTPTWDSTKTSGTAQQVASGPLPAGPYRAYVQVTETGDLDSPWTFTGFTVEYDKPAVPTLRADPDVQVSPASGAYPEGTDPYPVVRLTVSGHDNLLPVDDASCDGSLGTWVALANATVGQTSAWSLDGVKALMITATAAGDASAECDPVAVITGATYTARAVAHAATTGRTVTLTIAWLDVNGDQISTSSSSDTDATDGDLTLSVTASAPANTVTAQLQLTVTGAAAGEAHYVDETGIFPGVVDAWSRGGLAGTARAYITYDDGTGTQVPIRTTTNGVALPAPDQTVTVVDAEVIPGQPRTYTAYVAATI